MKVLTCENLGQSHCDFIAEGEDNDDITDAMVMHMMKDHPAIIESGSEGNQQAIVKNMTDILDAH